MKEGRNLPLKVKFGREGVACFGLCGLYLIIQGVFFGLDAFHIGVIILFLTLYSMSQPTQRLALSLVPFIFLGISYDWMAFLPTYKVNDVDIEGLYEMEKKLFGIREHGNLLIPSEYFALHASPISDFFAGNFYLTWVPVPMLFGIIMFLKNQRLGYLRFAIAFLFVNYLGFITYYMHPAAPPWYVMQYGTELIPDTPGNPAGLARWDDVTHIPIFRNMYRNNSNVFAAFPSLHAAYMLIAAIYAILTKQSKSTIITLFVLASGIWWAAVYSAHHYVIDILGGIACACLGVFLFERVLLRVPVLKKGLDKYAKRITAPSSIFSTLA